MKYSSLFAAVIILLCFNAFAADTPTSAPALVKTSPPQDKWGYSGQAILNDRWEDKPNGNTNLIRMSGRMDGWLNLSDDGCVKLRGRIDSGDTFNSEWNNTGLSDEEIQLNVHLRHLYIDSTCLNKQLQVQAGAMPVPGDGVLGLANNGWVDGIRIEVKSKDNKKSLAMTLGEVDELKTPNLFARNRNGTNLKKLEYMQKIGEQTTVMMAVADYNDVVYSRLYIEYALNKYADWLTSIDTELLFSNDNGQELIGNFQRLTVQVKKWRVQVYRAEFAKDLTDPEKLGLAVKNYLGGGKNMYVNASRPLTERTSLQFRARAGEADEQVEAGLVYRFGRPKK